MCNQLVQTLNMFIAQRLRAVFLPHSLRICARKGEVMGTYGPEISRVLAVLNDGFSAQDGLCIDDRHRQLGDSSMLYSIARDNGLINES